MTRCTSCTTEIPAGSHFCLNCGTPQASEISQNSAATIALPASSSPANPSSHRLRTSSSGVTSELQDQRFPPGTLVASRYRIVARLGKGGMGEVFRADDLILGQAVALKFLPPAMAGNANLLTRFYDEVRIARQVTHPNVCRVYDIGEMEGQPYLSMQYIDGEDLGSLLRRIGRLPADKATEFARRLCAGLAAAHAQGVLHRDLKPANIMVDARGQVVITDFGLAGIAGNLLGAEVRNGTPAYMAPEQLTGKEVSVRSDIYALGLVLYEMFTGKQPFEAATLAEMIRLRETSGPKGLSSYVHDLDDAVERTILRCLEPDPEKRPQSALAVSAALPGGDPLAAALAAGETPSPEMVAGAGVVEGLSPKIAAATLAAIVVLIGALLFLSPQTLIVSKTPLDHPPEVLNEKARDIVRNLGYDQRPVDHASGFDYDFDYLGYLQSKINSVNRWDAILASRPSAVEFWYRQSPRPLVSTFFDSHGIVWQKDPPEDVAGMVSIKLGMDGHLQSFFAVSPQMETSPTAGATPDWSAAFAAAGLDQARFQLAEPQWLPLSAIDTRAAWTGFYPGRTDLPIRIEAASWRGKPIMFQILGPWDTPARMQVKPESIQERVASLGLAIVIIAVIMAAILMARHNVRARRGDFHGAGRLAGAVFALVIVRWLLVAHHVSIADGEFQLFAAAVGWALLQGSVMWGFYLALEPWVRRLWPQTLIAWSRVLSGRFNDPLVGRDVLFSVLFALGYILVIVGAQYIAAYAGIESPTTRFDAGNLEGLRHIAGLAFQRAEGSLLGSSAFLLQIFLLRVVLRKQWLAAVVFVLVWTVIKSLGNGNIYFTSSLFFIIYMFIVVIVMGRGLFALALTLFLLDLTLPMLNSPDLFSWYGVSTLFILTLISALTIFGFRASLGGRKLFANLDTL